MRLDRPTNLKGIDFREFNELDTLDISFVESKSDLYSSESQLRLLFKLLQDCPHLRVLKLQVRALTAQTFAQLIMQYDACKLVKELIVLKTEEFCADFYPEDAFDTSPLSDLYVIETYHSKRIASYQSQNIAFYLHPLKSSSLAPSTQTVEIQLIVQKKFT